MKIAKDTEARLARLMQVHAGRHESYSSITDYSDLWKNVDNSRAEAAKALGAYGEAQRTEKRLLGQAGIAEGLAVVGLVGMLASPISALLVLGAAGVASYSIWKARNMTFEWPQR